MPTSSTKPFAVFARKLKKALLDWKDWLKFASPRLSTNEAERAYQLDRELRRHTGYRARKSNRVRAAWKAKLRNRARVQMQKLSRRINWGLK